MVKLVSEAAKVRSLEILASARALGSVLKGKEELTKAMAKTNHPILLVLAGDADPPSLLREFEDAAVALGIPVVYVASRNDIKEATGVRSLMACVVPFDGQEVLRIDELVAMG
ncbi:unnamed protein product [Arabidopsis lyrata]|uniref:Predicted protein n=1 Tax=Arabidopsis lyrata subsp. lyrata TaxID=81972 RepID=D7LTI7_ARALL|nr:predicted protein [Arabidopsis lyrata subsp. lyrata]CAH8268172.1 unnamed protein product [Arabidopsis lyrata]